MLVSLTIMWLPVLKKPQLEQTLLPICNPPASPLLNAASQILHYFLDALKVPMRTTEQQRQSRLDECAGGLFSVLVSGFCLSQDQLHHADQFRRLQVEHKFLTALL